MQDNTSLLSSQVTWWDDPKNNPSHIVNLLARKSEAIWFLGFQAFSAVSPLLLKYGGSALTSSAFPLATAVGLYHITEDSSPLDYQSKMYSAMGLMGMQMLPTVLQIMPFIAVGAGLTYGAMKVASFRKTDQFTLYLLAAVAGAPLATAAILPVLYRCFEGEGSPLKGALYLSSLALGGAPFALTALPVINHLLSGEDSQLKKVLDRNPDKATPEQYKAIIDKNLYEIAASFFSAVNVAKAISTICI
jgi:hypothetical protein